MLFPIALILLSQARPEPDWLPLLDAPKQLSHRLTIPSPANPGPKLVIKGKVLKADKSPAGGVILYFHHTDARGIYPRPSGADSRKWDYWHGTLRGWLKTDAQGLYELQTTRPAPYPGNTEPAHIHVYGLPSGSRTGIYFSDIVFQGDTLLSKPYWDRVRRNGQESYPGVHLSRGEDGVWSGKRVLTLPR